MKLIYTIPSETEYKNIKEVLKVEFYISDRLLLKLKKMQKIYLNNQNTYLHHPIFPGDIIQCDLEYEEDNSNIVPTKIPLNIIYEDDAYIVIDKPANIPIHPSQNHYTDSLSNGVRYYFDKINLKKKIRPVNRLDKDTSGLVIFAKNEYIQECLIRQMKSKEFVKKYIAIIDGHLDKKQGIINSPISRKEGSIIERCIDENGDPSITHYKVLDNSNKNFDVIECTLETGRTHQIRVHFSSIGHPLLGDTLYGKESKLISRQALHCHYLKFIHPITNSEVSYHSSLPNDINDFYSNIQHKKR